MKDMMAIMGDQGFMKKFEVNDLVKAAKKEI